MVMHGDDTEEVLLSGDAYQHSGISGFRMLREIAGIGVTEVSCFRKTPPAAQVLVGEGGKGRR